MRKKFIGVYALMAVLALGTTVTSCVDDNESASVTAIRDAKAKQLAALAAESEAMAEVNKAEAALKQAQADALNAKTEFEKQEYAMRLEKLRAEYDKAIAKAKEEQQAAEEAMQNSLIGQQNELWKQYTIAKQKYLDIFDRLKDLRLSLAQEEADLADTKALAAVEKHKLEIELAQNKAKLAALEEAEANDYEALKAQIAELAISIQSATKDVTAKGNALTNASDAYDVAYRDKFAGGTAGTGINEVTVESPLKTYKAYQYFNTNYMTLLRKGELVLAPNFDDKKTIADADASIQLYILNPEKLAAAKQGFTDLVDAKKEAYGTKDDKAYVPTNSGSLKNDIELSELFDQDVNETNYNQLPWIADGETAYAYLNTYVKRSEDAAKANKNNEDKLPKLVKALNKAEKAWEKAGKPESGDVFDAYTAAKSAKEACDAAIELYKETTKPQYDKDLKAAQDYVLAVADKYVKLAEENAANFDTYVAAMDVNSEDYKAYVAAAKSLMENEAKAAIEADVEAYNAKLTLAKLNAEKDALSNVIEGTADLDALKLNAQQAITNTETKIAKLDYILKDQDGVVAEEAYIDYLNEQIAVYEEELALAEQQAELYKNQFEASLKAE